jgi:uncharacterized protein YcgL (UPF0745 family)
LHGVNANPTFLYTASEGDISQMPSVLNGTIRYSAAVFIAELAGKKLEVRK